MTSLLRTLDDTVGPYFPAPFAPDSASLDLCRPLAGINVGPKGEPVMLRIRLLDVEGRLADSTVLELWYASESGHLRVPGTDKQLAHDPFFEGYGRAYSPTGEFAIRLPMPGSMKFGAATRAPHVTLTIFSDGLSRIVTQVFFEGQKANANDPVLAGLPADLADRLVARRGAQSSPAVYAIDIKMRGEGETPFFDDETAER